jgi:dTDP-4-amino-4,6-dideoxygalactose transaminase
MTDDFIKQGVDEINLIGGTMMYPLILPAQDTPAEEYIYRDRVMFELDKRGVESRTALPITDQPVYKSLVGRNPDKKFPIAGIFNRRGIFLPIHPYMAKSHCVYAVKSLKDAIYAANLTTIKC